MIQVAVTIPLNSEPIVVCLPMTHIKCRTKNDAIWKRIRTAIDNPDSVDTEYSFIFMSLLMFISQNSFIRYLPFDTCDQENQSFTPSNQIINPCLLPFLFQCQTSTWGLLNNGNSSGFVPSLAAIMWHTNKQKYIIIIWNIQYGQNDLNEAHLTDAKPKWRLAYCHPRSTTIKRAITPGLFVTLSPASRTTAECNPSIHGN